MNSIVRQDTLKKEIDFTEVQQICSEHQIEIRDLKLITGSFNKKIFIINQEFLLRASDTSMTLEEEKFKRVGTLNLVPQIIHTGILKREAGPIYYILLTLLPGDDFVNVYHETTEAQRKELGYKVAAFLDNLHELKDIHYDIGLYVTALPCFSGTWRDGHQKYWEILKQDSQRLRLESDSILVFERAFRFLQASLDVLDFQTGPRLLHNDFHPRNILLHHGKLSGVIDWECSQFGEADFELCHLIHWCVYPPKVDIDFRTFLRSLFEATPAFTQVPDLAQRLTVYQIEHEIQQIIWSAGLAESMRVPRLVRWLDGGADDLLKELGM